MLPKLIVHWNFTKGVIDECSRVLKNHKAQFRGSNVHVLIWFRAMLSGADNARQVSKAAWIVPHLEKHECLELLNAAFSKHGSFRKIMHTVSKHLMLEDRDGGHWKDPVATSSTSASASATTSMSDGTPCTKKMIGSTQLVVEKCEH